MVAFPPHYSNDAIQAYFSHITATASKRRRLFTVDEMSWGSCEFDHPASLETLDCSMNAERQSRIWRRLWELLQEDWEGVEEELPRPWPPGEWERAARCRHSQQARLRCLRSRHWVGGEQGATQGDLGENQEGVHGIDNQSAMNVKMADVLDVSDGLWAPDERIFVFVSDEAKQDTVFPAARLGGHGHQRLPDAQVDSEDPLERGGSQAPGRDQRADDDRKKEVDVGELLALVLGTNSGSNPDVVLEKVAEHIKSKKTKTSPASPSPFATPPPQPFAPASITHNHPSHQQHRRMLSSTHLARVLAELKRGPGPSSHHRVFSSSGHWIIRRQFLMNLVSHCFTIYAFYMGAIFWPPEFPEGSGASALVPVFVALFFVALLGRKKSNAYGFLVGGTSGFLSGLCSIMSTNQWVMLPLLAISCCGLFTPVLQPAPDRWYDGPGLFKFMVVYMTRGLSYMVACVLGTVAPPLGWHRQALLLVGSIAAIVHGMLIHFYMLQSPLEMLYGSCNRLGEMDMDKRLAVRQENAIEALREFAEATGNTLPKNLKSLRKPQSC
ncbi:hypothetical protein SELMODRAFT_413572 [Selaginella moellendorffii]|uniref:Uncharacterized protein n=1 Tax=Selaginella moellendorffii TaxID=88036 RepID=D8RQP8_SELML|nr:hypothetical protein SELMODRAFT_413572 [Selaginella moellendorffii]